VLSNEPMAAVEQLAQGDRVDGLVLGGNARFHAANLYII
jgi:hypothetical protein